MVNKKISVIGLGLIGGSIAKALSRIGVRDITAVDTDSESIKEALAQKVVARGFNEINEHVLSSDIIFICTCVENAVRYLDELACRGVGPDTVVTDVCSTKSRIISHIDSMKNPPCFVGGHPMAGTEKTGYSFSFAHLFENAYYILVPSGSTKKHAMDLMTRLVEAIGAIPVQLDAHEHDRITGGISHVPHIIAASLVNLVRKLDTPDGKMRMLAAGGFKDLTRTASSNPALWGKITLSNKKHISDMLNLYIHEIRKFQQMLDSGSADEIHSFFESAKVFRDSILSGLKG